MQSFTITQWAIVTLVFVGGWLLGLASHSGGRKWRDRYAAEREGHAAAKRDAEAREVVLRQDADARVEAAEARHRELERDHARLAQASTVTITPRHPIVTTATQTSVPGERRGWFDWNNGARP